MTLIEGEGGVKVKITAKVSVFHTTPPGATLDDISQAFKRSVAEGRYLIGKLKISQRDAREDDEE